MPLKAGLSLGSSHAALEPGGGSGAQVAPLVHEVASEGSPRTRPPFLTAATKVVAPAGAPDCAVTCGCACHALARRADLSTYAPAGDAISDLMAADLSPPAGAATSTSREDVVKRPGGPR
jgi:hypothetical protein